MPVKISMRLSNNNPSITQIKALTLHKEGLSKAPQPSSSLNTSMITRIHTTKPGCGSCGRH